jgi:hypothetical protein
MGWAPATEISRSDWIAPFLAPLLSDSYPAVRAIAYRSLRKIPGFEDFQYNRTGLREERAAAVQRVLSRSHQLQKNNSRQVSGKAILRDSAGSLQQETYDRLLSERDDQIIFWKE